MLGCTPTGRKFKLFVKETSSDDPPGASAAPEKYLPVRPLTGDKAKQFYEEILNEPSSAPEKEKPKPKPKPKSQPRFKPTRPKKFKNTDLLWMAQNNDVKSLTSFFQEPADCDVNVVDEFGWTPLMCASCSGAEDAVQILLQKGADPNKGDKLGNTAHKLAQQRNHKRITQMLENCQKECQKEKRRARDPPKQFFCRTCNGSFMSSRHRHESSTLHLFNCPMKTSTFYGIPETNKGFQLLLKEGWEKEKGLGPDGKGRKFPVRAVMKKDRTGIGAPPMPERSRNESHSINEYDSKKGRLNKLWRDKHFEKNFRLEFS